MCPRSPPPPKKRCIKPQVYKSTVLASKKPTKRAIIPCQALSRQQSLCDFMTVQTLGTATQQVGLSSTPGHSQVLPCVILHTKPPAPLVGIGDVHQQAVKALKEKKNRDPRPGECCKCCLEAYQCCAPVLPPLPPTTMFGRQGQGTSVQCPSSENPDRQLKHAVQQHRCVPKLLCIHTMLHICQAQTKTSSTHAMQWQCR